MQQMPLFADPPGWTIWDMTRVYTRATFGDLRGSRHRQPGGRRRRLSLGPARMLRQYRISDA